MRVKFKDKKNRISVVESVYVYETANGIDVHYKYASFGRDLRADVYAFDVDNAKELLNEAFETGLLDLTNAVLIED